MLTALNSVLTNLKATSTAIDTVLDGFTDTVSDRKRTDLRAGLSADGGNIKPIYSESYKVYKNSKSTYYAPSGTPDLYNTGAFAKSIFSTRKGFEYFYQLKGAPDYAPDIRKKYSEPSGISPQGKEDLDNKLSIKLEEALSKIWN